MRCRQLMAPSVDLVVRITAVTTLERVVDDFEFWPDVLLPYLADLMLLLYRRNPRVHPWTYL